MVQYICTSLLQENNNYLCTSDLWSFKDTSDPQEQGNDSSNSKLNCCDVNRIWENFEDLSNIGTVKEVALTTGK
jgi:hypothetical protein